MKPRTTYITFCLILILTAFNNIVYGQEITLMDFGLNQPTRTTPGNWNNVTNSSTLNSTTNLIDNSGLITGEILTLTDPFDDDINGWGTTAPSSGLPFPSSATRDNFFGEITQFTDVTTSLEPTGGFTLSGLELGKYYSFTIFASRTGVSDNRETLYTITGNAGAQTTTLDAANNTSNVATILNVQPNSSGEITIQATTGPNNTNSHGFYYLGAIEMIKSDSPSTITWNGTTWSNVTGPNLTTQAIIAADYNTDTNGSFSAYNLIIDATAKLIVSNQTFVEVENDVVVDGELWVETQGNFVQNNDDGVFTDNSVNGVQVTKTKTMTYKYGYTYWSSPVVDETMQQVFSTTPGDRRFKFVASNFIDTKIEIGNTNTFTLGQDDIDDNGDDWQRMVTGTLVPGVGYAVTPSLFGPAFPRDEDFVFIGGFNNGVVQTPLVNNSGGVYNDWNLIGNPYPGAISADAFLSVNSGLVDIIYLWDQATPASSTSGGSQGFNFSANDYAMINGVMEIGARGDIINVPKRFIPSGQGFFVEALATGNVTFNNSMRSISNDNSQFFKPTSNKSDSNTIANKLWVNLKSDNGVFNQIGIAYVSGATNENDGGFYDAKRFLASGNKTILYSTIENDNGKFAIQGKAAHSLDANETIKLGFATNINVATLYTLSIAQLQGEFLTNNAIYLKDNLLNKIHNLSEADYTFTSEVGEFNDRFVIMFNSQSLSTDELLASTNALNIIDLDNERVKFTTTNRLKIKNVSIFDILGRELYKFKGENSEEIYHLASLKNAIYIAKVELSNGAIITKKAIKK